MPRVWAPRNTCEINCTSRAAKFKVSTNPCSLLASPILVAQLLDGSGCETPTHNVESQNTCTFSLISFAAGSFSNVLNDQRNVFQSCNTCILYAASRWIKLCTCRCTDCITTCVLGKLLFAATRLNSLWSLLSQNEAHEQSLANWETNHSPIAREVLSLISGNPRYTTTLHRRQQQVLATRTQPSLLGNSFATAILSRRRWQKLLRKHKGACKSSWNPIGSLKSFTLTIPWNSAKLVKISPGIVVRLHPHISETNGIAERAVRRVKESTSAVLLQSGLNESWWADSMESFTYMRNFTDLWSDGKTPYDRRFGQPFKGPIIPFGSLVEYHPITAKDQSKIHQIGEKVLPGLFLGYALYVVRIWKGDVLVADLEELETMDASEIYSKRLDAKGVIFPKEKHKLFLQY